MPELGALEVLLAVARHGSFNAASTELGISQQAVSARIASMEAQTGVPLVTRTRRGSSLTPAGTVVAEWAARLLDVAGEVDAGLATLRADRRARLRISASLTVADQLLPGWLVSLRAAARHRGEEPPEIFLNATNSEHVVDDVRDDRADLGFVEGPHLPRGLRSRVVAHDELVLVVPPDHPWARRRTPVRPAELAATALVTREEGSGTRTFLSVALQRVLGAETEQAPPALALSTVSAVRAAVRAGAGAAVLSRLAVSDDVAAGRLRIVPVAELDLARTLRAVWTGPDRGAPGPARDLLSHITTRPAL